MGDSSSDHHKLQIVSADPENGYALSGKLMLSLIVVLFSAVILMVGLHMIAKRYIAYLRRRQYERRRDLLVSRSQVLLYIDSLSTGDQGLDPQVLNSLPMYFYTPRPEQPPTECAVCLSEFQYKDVVRLLPKCNHCFHLECIDTWFRSHSTCPICRSSVELVAGTVIRPVWKLNVPEPGSSSGCATCQHVEGNGDGSTTLSGGLKMELVEVRVEMPPWRVAVENEISQNAAADRLSLTRITSGTERIPSVYGGQPPPRVVARSLAAAGSGMVNGEPGRAETAA